MLCSSAPLQLRKAGCFARSGGECEQSSNEQSTPIYVLSRHCNRRWVFHQVKPNDLSIYKPTVDSMRFWTHRVDSTGVVRSCGSGRSVCGFPGEAGRHVGMCRQMYCRLDISPPKPEEGFESMFGVLNVMNA